MLVSYFLNTLILKIAKFVIQEPHQKRNWVKNVHTVHGLINVSKQAVTGQCHLRYVSSDLGQQLIFSRLAEELLFMR